jgi:RNA polymerase sigma-70 factor (ECF subfamily)
MEENGMVASVVTNDEPADVAQLVERARDGDRDAYGELVRRFRPGIYAVLLSWLHDPAEADDVAQDVFLHGMRKLGQLRDARCFAGWLRQIAVRLALNRLSRRRPSSGGFSRLANLPAAGMNPAEEMERAEQRTQVREGLQEMSIAFDAPLGTIKRRLHTARQLLREHLESHAGPPACPA